MKKRILSLCFVLALLLSLLPAGGITAMAAPEGTPLNGVLGSKTLDTGNYYLSGNATGNITVPANKAVTLDLNGYVLSAASGSVITNSGTLIIQDSNTSNQTHNFEVTSPMNWRLAGDSVLADYTFNAIDGLKTSGGETSTDIPSENKVIKVTGGCITGGTGSSKDGDHWYGGGIYNKGTLTIEGGCIVGNCADNSGGGIYNYKGTLTQTGGGIIGNTAGSNGGGVYNHSTGTFTLTGGKIMGNTASKGAGVYNYGTLKVGGTAYIENNAVDNLYLTKGKSVEILSDNPLVTGACIGVTTTESPQTILTTNNAEDYFSFFKSDDAGYVVINTNNGETHTLTLTGRIKLVTGENIESHYRTILDALDALENKTGTICLLADDTENITIDKGMTVTLDLNGYVLNGKDEGTVITNKGTLTIQDSRPDATHNFIIEDGLYKLDEENGTVPVTGGLITGGNGKKGGGINNKGDLTITGGSIIGNTANYGGGVYTGKNHTFTMVSGKILGNKVYTDTQTEPTETTVSGGNGGGVYIYVGSFIMNGGEISDNTAEHRGGGVYAYKNIDADTIAFDLNSGTLISNSAEDNGDGVYVISSSFTMLDGTLNNNRAEDNGGGVYISKSSFTMLSGTITGNTAKFGGGVYDYRSDLTLGKKDTTSGKILITDNCGTGFGSAEKTCNVFLTTNDEVRKEGKKDGDAFIEVYPLDAESRIGVSMEVLVRSADYTGSETGRFTTNGTAEDVKYFTSDASGYVVSFTNSGTESDLTNGYLKIAAQQTSSHSSKSTVTVPVEGDKDAVKVKATVSGTNATIKNVTATEIEKVGTDSTVVVNLTSLKPTVTGVTIPKTTLENVVASEAEGLEVRLPNGVTATFDKTTLSAIAEQAQGKDIRLVVDRDEKAEKSMTAAQKATLKTLNKPIVLDAYFVSNMVRIHDFKGGTAELTADYYTENPVRVWWLIDDGTKDLVPSTFDGEKASFVVTHFSHYVIEQLDGNEQPITDPTGSKCPQDETCVYAKFTDSDTKAWYHPGVHFCVEKGYMNGTAETLFEPNSTLSRGMIVTMLWRMEDSPVVNYAMSFADVEADLWYTEAIRWAQSTGVVKGYDDVSFGPNDNVTREQLAAILMRYADCKGIDVSARNDISAFTDASEISAWALENLQWANAVEMVTGRTETTIAPTGNATRAEAATMVQRFCETVLK